MPSWILICRRTLSCLLKVLSQISHLNRSVFSWTELCCLKLTRDLKLAPHELHLKGRSPVWILRCASLLAFVLNPFLQKSQKWETDPVWTFSWYCFDANCEKARAQYRHLNGFSPLWVRRWFVRVTFVANDFLQWAQENFVRSTRCSFMCVNRLAQCLNRTAQKSQYIMLSGKWVMVCSCSCSIDSKIFVQWKHSVGFKVCCWRTCLRILLSVGNIRLQRSQRMRHGSVYNTWSSFSGSSSSKENNESSLISKEIFWNGIREKCYLDITLNRQICLVSLLNLSHSEFLTLGIAICQDETAKVFKSIFDNVCDEKVPFHSLRHDFTTVMQ